MPAVSGFVARRGKTLSPGLGIWLIADSVSLKTVEPSAAEC
jgi:hypothetical protein